jgi:hypothetical protein
MAKKMNVSMNSRMLLRIDLGHSRIEPLPDMFGVRCPFCNRGVYLTNGDLHEALITRGQVRGHIQQDFIYSRYNCILRHHETAFCSHTGGVGGNINFEKAARYLAKWEGYQPIHAWLSEAKNIWPVVGAEALRRFEGVFGDEHTKDVVPA